MASRSGFEPPTCRLGGGCSIRLSYRDLLSKINMLHYIKPCFSLIPDPPLYAKRCCKCLIFVVRCSATVSIVQTKWQLFKKLLKGIPARLFVSKDTSQSARRTEPKHSLSNGLRPSRTRCVRELTIFLRTMH
jgi:hypothetical protein